MKRNITIEQITQTPIEKQQIELVERKGVGHPDSLADGLAESVSRALCKEYSKRCGTILHHNTDETQIVAGRSCPEWGGGEVIKPIYMLLVGRATKEFNGVEIPAGSVALKAAREYVRKTLANIDVDSHVIFDVKLGTGSSDLRAVFAQTIPSANDTSFGVGHAPLSETEQIVYHAERGLINVLKKKHPAIGEDIKVMGLRNGDDITFTVACAMVDRYVDNVEEYVSTKQAIKDYIEEMAQEFTHRRVNVHVNTADDIEHGSVFLTVTGTSAEMGDDGSVGRGNRCNGLITPNRPMSMEATSGKNPINHIGKIYNLLSNQIAHDIVEVVDGIEDIYIRILSQIGKPIDQPLVASAQVIPKAGVSLESIEPEIYTVMDEWFNDITKITDMVAEGDINTF